MAFVTQKVVTFTLGESYRGPQAVIQFDFPFVFADLPGTDAIGQLDAIVRVGLFSASIIPGIKDNYLGYELAADTTPFIDRYQVTVHVAGDTQEQSGTIGPFLAKRDMPYAHHRMARPLARVSHRRVQVYPQAFIAAAMLIAVAVAIGILLVFATISYKILNGSWGPAALGWGLLLPIALVGAGVYLVSSGALGGRQSARGGR